MCDSQLARGLKHASSRAVIVHRNGVMTHVSCALHRLSPPGVDRCPVPSFRVTNCELIVPRRMPLCEPLPLYTPTLVNGARIPQRAACPCLLRLMVASHLSRYMRTSHPDTPPRCRRKRVVTTANHTDNNVVLEQALGCQSAGTVRARCQAQLA